MRKLKKVFITTIVVLTLSASSVYAADNKSFVQGATGNPLSTISTYAGNGEFGSTDGVSINAQYRAPQGIALAPDGSIFVADTQNHLIRQVQGNQVTTYAGLTLDLDEKGLPEGG